MSLRAIAGTQVVVYGLVAVFIVGLLAFEFISDGFDPLLTDGLLLGGVTALIAVSVFEIFFKRPAFYVRSEKIITLVVLCASIACSLVGFLTAMGVNPYWAMGDNQYGIAALVVIIFPLVIVPFGYFVLFWLSILLHTFFRKVYKLIRKK